MRREVFAAVSAVVLLAGGAVTGCAQNTRTEDARASNTLTEQERADGWQLLFDGRTASSWRGFKQDALPAGWQVVDGTLSRVGVGGDIITVEQYDSFELALDWKIETGGNSGIFFHVVETGDYVWQSGPEMQILDDDGHNDGRTPETSVGSNYALHAPAQSVARPIGEWNSIRLVVHGDHVEHWMNGVRIVSYELGSADWQAKVAASKFNTMPNYGQARRGHIALQDHGDPVWFRNIRIRRLPAGAHHD